MKAQGRLFKKLSKKIAGFTVAMLALQPMLMVGVMPAKAFAAVNPVVINEVQTGGLTASDEFVELFNPTINDIDVAGWKIQYKSATGETWVTRATLTGTVQAIGYYLVGSGNINAKPDDAWSTTLSSTAGHVRILDEEDRELDRVGYGETADSPEGNPAVAPATEDSITRTNGRDTDDNNADFSVSSPPDPQNSFYPAPVVTVDEQLTNDRTPEITGSVDDPEASLEVTVNGQDYIAVNNGDGTWTAGVTEELSDGAYDVAVSATDEGDNVGDDSTTGELIVDATAPTFESTVTPSLANQDNKTVDIEITPSEELLEQDAPVVVLNERVVVLGATYGVKLTIKENLLDPLTIYVFKDTDGKYKYTYTIEDKGEKTINFDIEGTDLAGNESVDQNGSFTLDNIAPGKVTDLKAVAGNAMIDLSWKNPTADTSFAGVRIVRTGSDGSTWESTALTTGEAFTDATVKNGVTYTYDVYAVDIAKNESGKTSVSATPSAPAVTQAISAASTSRVASAIATDTFTPPTSEVKAAEISKDDDQGQADDKGAEVKETKKIPVWGIIFLLILASIGGYLFYVQNPENKNHPKI